MEVLYFRLNEPVARRQIIGLKGVQAQAEKLCGKRAREIYEDKKEQFIQEFKDDKISEELDAGPLGGNLAGLIPKAQGDDNLFGFIGFKDGDNPVQEVIDIIQQNIHLFEKGQVKSSNREQLQFSFRVEAPSLDNLAKITPYPTKYSPGSWLRGIEDGISGLSFYISKLGFGRSLGGIQKNKGKEPYRRSGGDKSKPAKYYSKHLAKFIANLNKVFK